MSVNVQRMVVTQNEAYQGKKLYTETLPLIEINGRLELSENLVNTARECDGNYEKLSEANLVEIIANLEHEREAYLDALTVLQDQLRESHEQCHQLSQSHAEIIGELEAEIASGWEQAKHYKGKYTKIKQAIKSYRKDLKNPKKLLEMLENNEGSSRVTHSARSTYSCSFDDSHTSEFLESHTPSRSSGVWVYTLNNNLDSCTFVANSDAEHDGPGQDDSSSVVTTDSSGSSDSIDSQDPLGIYYDWKTPNADYQGWIYVDTPMAVNTLLNLEFDPDSTCGLFLKSQQTHNEKLFDLLDVVDF
ncbi:hypothetical protein BdWA1_000017 [Babesia duncani]|uniref:Uncharacterized protein n=1 Tax=Babesia duncani TaxID=323732 RepID=A0AAD9PMB8_9APIC|nr:hypothetical protein BdWA1_000017 [Babesia duncani]